MLLYCLVDGIDELFGMLRPDKHATVVHPFDPDSLIATYVVGNLPRCPTNPPATELSEWPVLSGFQLFDF